MWSDSCAKANASKLAKFGEPITYTPAIGGVPGIPLPATAIRLLRVRQGQGANPQWEEISLDPSTLPGYPAEGDSVILLSNNLTYAVKDIRQPEPYGLAILTLNQRSGQPQS